MLIAQISDSHVTEQGAKFADRVDTGARLEAAVRTLNALDPRPDLVIATGDLVDAGTSTEYDRLLDVLGELEIAVVPIPGNHDDRQEMRRRFPDVLPSGTAMDPVDFTIEEHPVRLVMVDTTIPGRHDGELSHAQLQWLDERLSEQPDRPTMVVQHHPPVPSGITWMDAANGLAGADREAAVLDRHRQVAAVVCGHLHRSIARSFGATTAIVCPSTAAQLSLDLGGDVVRYTDEPAALLLHHWRADDGLATHLVPIGEHERWTPSWFDATPI